MISPYPPQIFLDPQHCSVSCSREANGSVCLCKEFLLECFLFSLFYHFANISFFFLLSNCRVSSTLYDPLEKLLEKPEKPKEKAKTSAVNAVLMSGVDSSISLRDLREVISGFIGSVTFEIARVDATSVVILPDSLGSDMALLEELLSRIVEILKSELPGVFSSAVCCWGKWSLPDPPICSCLVFK